MEFAAVRLSEFEKPQLPASDPLQKYGTGLWYMALLNCGGPESSCTLTVYESSPGVFCKYVFSPTGFSTSGPGFGMEHHVSPMRISIQRAHHSGASSSDWKDWNGPLVNFRIARPPLPSGAESYYPLCPPVMKPIARSVLQDMASRPPSTRAPESQRRDKIILKGPCRTSSFQLQYVYVGKFRET